MHLDPSLSCSEAPSLPGTALQDTASTEKGTVPTRDLQLLSLYVFDFAGVYWRGKTIIFRREMKRSQGVSQFQLRTVSTGVFISGRHPLVK